MDNVTNAIYDSAATLNDAESLFRTFRTAYGLDDIGRFWFDSWKVPSFKGCELMKLELHAIVDDKCTSADVVFFDPEDLPTVTKMEIIELLGNALRVISDNLNMEFEKVED